MANWQRGAPHLHDSEYDALVDDIRTGIAAHFEALGIAHKPSRSAVIRMAVRRLADAFHADPEPILERSEASFARLSSVRRAAGRRGQAALMANGRHT